LRKLIEPIYQVSYDLVRIPQPLGHRKGFPAFGWGSCPRVSGRACAGGGGYSRVIKPPKI